MYLHLLFTEDKNQPSFAQNQGLRLAHLENRRGRKTTVSFPLANSSERLCKSRSSIAN